MAVGTCLPIREGCLDAIGIDMIEMDVIARRRLHVLTKRPIENDLLFLRSSSKSDQG